jgi:hypothetical protein
VPTSSDSERRARFVALSSEWTGFSPFEIERTGSTDTLLRFLDETLGAAWIERPHDTTAADVTVLWYTGSWRRRSGETGTVVAREIIDEGAYLEALVFRAIGANPMGGKPPGYGAWALAPEWNEDER